MRFPLPFRLSLAAGVLLAVPFYLAADEPAAKAGKPQVEVVFCLDTTGSMGGLIDAAKKKIWSISNQIAAGKPTPELKVGLVAYRDRRDEYVTKVLDLTDDLDAVYANLMKFQAGGGGDTPESVNQALHEAVTKINWGKDAKTLRILFLVGDAPPKMDYADDVKYQDTCQLAARSGIIINTIQCGNLPDTQKYWQDICHLAEGQYVKIDQQGGPVVVVATPHDGKLAEINRELATTTLAFGTVRQQAATEKAKKDVTALAAPAAADRAGFYANSARGASYDLLENLRRGAVKLEELKAEELPPQLRGKSSDEQKAYLKTLTERREELNRQAVELDRQRQAFIQQKLKEDAAKTGGRGDSFDQQVLNILQTQARRANIEYGTATGKKE